MLVDVADAKDATGVDAVIASSLSAQRLQWRCARAA